MTSLLYILGGSMHGKALFEAFKQRYSEFVILNSHIAKKWIAMIYFENGKVKKCKRRMHFIPNPAQNFFISAPITLLNWGILVANLVSFYVSVTRNFRIGKLNVCVAEGSSALVGVILQKAGLVRKVIYVAEDWYGGRAIQTTIFSILDMVLVRKTDETWNVTKKIRYAREQTWVASKFLDKTEKVMKLPLANPVANSVKFKPNIETKIACIGGIIREDAGLDLVVHAISVLRSEGITFSLEVTGSNVNSRIAKEIRHMAEVLHVSEQVNFRGYLDEDALHKLLQSCHCGLALFLGGIKNYSNYTRPFKVTAYIENGLPVIINSDSALAKELTAEGVGIAVDCSIDSITNALRKLGTDHDFASKLRESTLKYASILSSPKELWNAIESVSD